MWQASRGCKSVVVRTTEKGDQPSRAGWATNPRKLASSFPGETPAGAAQLAAKVRAAISVRFHGDDQPGVVMTNRGQGFFRLKNGRITPEYSSALQEHGLRAFMGYNASRQPGDLKELMLHETAMAWATRMFCLLLSGFCWRRKECSRCAA